MKAIRKTCQTIGKTQPALRSHPAAAIEIDGCACCSACSPRPRPSPPAANQEGGSYARGPVILHCSCPIDDRRRAAALHPAPAALSPSTMSMVDGSTNP